MADSERIAPGKIVAIGGAEDKTSRSAILKTVLGLAPEGNRSIGVITTASGIPEEVFETYDAVFSDLGANAVHHVNVFDRDGARDPAYVETVEQCGVIFMSGGDQLRLTHILGASPLLAAMREARDRGAVIAGTSAGAAAMSSTMIYDGLAADALRKGAVKMAAGLAFVDDVVIDSHFLERGRFTRLMEVGATNPHYTGVGLGENAAVIVHEGQVLEAIGTGHVVIVDSTELSYSNVAELSDGEPVATAHMVMHALTSGFGYSVRERRFLDKDALKSSLEGKTIADTRA